MYHIFIKRYQFFEVNYFQGKSSVVIGSFLFFPCNTEVFRCKIPGYAKKFQIKVGFVLIGVNAESKS